MLYDASKLDIINDGDTLEKSWREELHPRGKDGKFSKIRSGSPVIAKNGTKGKVAKVTSDHYHIEKKDGKTSKIKKDNVIHAKDHEELTKPKKKPTKKTTKKKTTASKTKTKKKAPTKRQANGGKTKIVVDPTKKKPKKKAPAKTTTTDLSKMSDKEVNDAYWAERKKVEQSFSNGIQKQIANTRNLRLDRGDISMQRKSKKRQAKLEEIDKKIFESQQAEDNVKREQHQALKDFDDNHPLAKERVARGKRQGEEQAKQMERRMIDNAHELAKNYGGYANVIDEYHKHLEDAHKKKNRANASEASVSEANYKINLIRKKMEHVRKAGEEKGVTNLPKTPDFDKLTQPKPQNRKTPEEKHGKFYRGMKVNGKTTFVHAEGATPTKVHEDIDAFHHYKDGKHGIFEARTGMAIGNGQTKADAIDNAKAQIDKVGVDKVKNLVESNVNRMQNDGLHNPRYYKKDNIEKSINSWSDFQKWHWERG